MPRAPAGDLCGPAIVAAEREVGLPHGLLAAIALVESGRPDPTVSVRGGARIPLPAARVRVPLLRRVALQSGPAMGRMPSVPPVSTSPQPVRAWPWTINADGQGAFFRTEAGVIAAVRGLQRLGVSSIDVGCLQVNLAYHPHAFRTLQEAFNPASNALYAARFLARLFDRFHSWPAAVAAYHSQTPTLGASYRRRVMVRWLPIAARATRPAGAYADFLHASAKYADFARR